MLSAGSRPDQEAHQEHRGPVFSTEVQRLRASSEHKIKEWFNDTRAEREKSQETHANFHGQMNAEPRLKGEYKRKIEKTHKAYLAEKNRAN
jgi:hypothetical protein